MDLPTHLKQIQTLEPVDHLRELEHLLWRCSLPSDYQPLYYKRQDLPVQAKPLERAWLDSLILKVKLQIAEEGVQFQTLRSGHPDHWLVDYADSLRRKIGSQ